MEEFSLLSEGVVLLFVGSTLLPQTPMRTLPVAAGTNYRALQKRKENRTSIYEQMATPQGRDQTSPTSQRDGWQSTREDDYVTNTPASQHNYVTPVVQWCTCFIRRQINMFHINHAQLGNNCKLEYIR